MSNARNIADLPNGDDAPMYACRAFVTYDTQNDLSPASILGNIKSSNVSSVTRVSEGRYQINFASSMPTANYVVAAIHSYNTELGDVMSTCTGTKDVDYCEILTTYHYSAYGLFDNDEISVAFFF